MERAERHKMKSKRVGTQMVMCDLYIIVPFVPYYIRDNSSISPPLKMPSKRAASTTLRFAQRA